MDLLWPNPKNDRQAREYHQEEDHLDFPSNEGALMTIGFLTFAVFLIKLVLVTVLKVHKSFYAYSLFCFQKLIHALKSKYNNYNNDMTTTMSTYFGRKKRADEHYENAVKILNLIDQYKFN